MKILLVDDSKAIHSLLNEMLDGSQIVLQHVYDGREAIAAVTAANFDGDLVLLDWEMPELCGIDALPELRKFKEHLSIVMMSSKNSMSNIVEAMQKGATDYMMKPFTKDILLGKLKEIKGWELAK